MRARWSLVIALTFTLPGCQPAAKPTPAGTVVVEWTQTMKALATGVGIGAPVGAPIRERKTVVFTPDTEVRDRSLKPARLEVTTEREDVALTPDATGARPAPIAALPLHLTAKVVDGGGWQFQPATCDPPSGPGDIGERDRRVGFFETCWLPMRGGREDIADVRITVAGSGAHAVAASYGSATLATLE